MYKNLKKHIQVNLDLEGYHEKGVEKYSLMEEYSNKKLTNLLQIIRIDVPYYRKKCYNESIKDLDPFTKLIGLFDIEDEEFMKKLCKGDRRMGEIYDRIEKYNDDEDVIGAYDYELKQKLILESKFEQGISQGMKNGIKQRNIEIVKNLLKQKVDLKLIQEVTGLSKQEIKEIM